jgi:hypothetical protein
MLGRKSRNQSINKKRSNRDDLIYAAEAGQVEVGNDSGSDRTIARTLSQSLPLLTARTNPAYSLLLSADPHISSSSSSSSSGSGTKQGTQPLFLRTSLRLLNALLLPHAAMEMNMIGRGASHDGISGGAGVRHDEVVAAFGCTGAARVGWVVAGWKGAGVEVVGDGCMIYARAWAGRGGRGGGFGEARGSVGAGKACSAAMVTVL